ncbi:MAG: universal stress protein [Cytophagaceae bacterium]|jgi:nucleotide-binding universal stress UspA family protein|nr:universal stress protein [Cytophagaceae bacterium]
MSAFKTILVPTDFSDNALAAAEFALDLAQRFQARVVLLHVIHVPVSQIQEDAMILIERQNERRAESFQSLLALEQALHPRFPAVPVIKEVKQGFLADTIQEVVEMHQVDLIVMGTKGASGVGEVLVGSNTVRVMDTVDIPVFIIPNEYSPGKIQKIVFASDFEWEDADALADVVPLAQSYQSEIQVVHMTAAPQSSEEERLRWLKELAEKRFNFDQISYKLIPKQENNFDTIIQYLSDQHADLVVMNASGKNLLQRLFKGSLTHKMAYRTGIPFLVFHVKVPNKL